MAISLAMVMLVTVPEAAADYSVARSPSPLSNPATWVTPADYPAVARLAGAEGTTGFRLEVDSLGQVTSCEVVSPSGSTALDQATCFLVSQRARFRPAQDVAGKPKPGQYSSRIRWVLPTPPGPLSGRLVTSYLVATDGTVSDCKVVEHSGAASRSAENPDFKCTPTPRLQPYRDAAGNPVRKRVSSTLEVQVDSIER